MSGTVTEPVAAWVAGRPILAREVDERLEQLRRGTFGSRLPGPATAEGRNARRWVVQLVCAQAVVEQELRRRGLAAVTQPGPALSLPDALAMGGVTAAVLSGVPGCTDLMSEVSGAVQPTQGQVEDYYRRNLDLFQDGRLPLTAVHDRIAEELAAAERRRRFSAWLEGELATSVRTEPGFEHPGDPRHPDATHRH